MEKQTRKRVWRFARTCKHAAHTNLHTQTHKVEHDCTRSHASSRSSGRHQSPRCHRPVCSALGSGSVLPPFPVPSRGSELPQARQRKSSELGAPHRPCRRTLLGSPSEQVHIGQCPGCRVYVPSLLSGRRRLGLLLPGAGWGQCGCPGGCQSADGKPAARERQGLVHHHAGKFQG